MHFKPLKIFPVFIFTLEEDCNKNWIFCFPSDFWPLNIKIFLTFILYFFTQNCKIFIFYFIGKGLNVDINPLKTALEAIGDANRQQFFKANFTPSKLTIL